MWEDSEQPVPILVNGYTSSVRPNLASALSHFRQEKGPFTDVPLWIDAISIDQSNIAERNWQVRIMTKIYTKSQKRPTFGLESQEETQFAMAKMQASLYVSLVGRHKTCLMWPGVNGLLLQVEATSLHLRSTHNVARSRRRLPGHSLPKFRPDRRSVRMSARKRYFWHYEVSSTIDTIRSYECTDPRGKKYMLLIQSF